MSDTKTISDIEQVLKTGQKKGPIAFLRHPVVLVGLAIAVIAFVVLARSGEGTGPVSKYTTQKVERGSLLVSVSATGTLEPLNEVAVGIEVSGTIKSVLVDFNDPVTEGQVLAVLDTSILESEAAQMQAALALANANYEEAQASVSEAANEVARLEDVYERSGGVIPSAKDMDAAKATQQRSIAAAASAKAQIDQAKAQLAVQRTQLSKAKVKSPINGVILSREIDPGQTVAASLQTPELFVIAEDLSKMELHVDVDKADVGQIREGQSATFTVDAYPEEVFPAVITQVRVAPDTTEGVVTYETILSVDNSDLRLLPGMTATAEIIVDQVEDALLVPNEALRFEPAAQQAGSSGNGGGVVGALMPRPPSSSGSRSTSASTGAQKQIWLLKDGQAEALTITTSATDGTYTEVVSDNLEEGAAVIVDEDQGK